MIYQKLRELASHGESIRVGAYGAGWMGSGFVAAVRHVDGMDVSILADADTAAARDAFIRFGGIAPERIVETDDESVAADAIAARKYVVTGDLSLAARTDGIDIVTDVTPSPATGAAVALAGIEYGKDVVLINIEADVTVGRELAHRARKAGVMYTVSSGDEPGCLMELWDFVNTMGHEPIVIGKGKNNPLDPDANPDTVRASAEKAGKDPVQVASYVDGTKTMFEMTCVANATGCLPMKPGMVGPDADLTTVSSVFALETDGGITTRPGTVDFVQGSAMSGGVFITVKVSDERIADDLNYLKVGKGKYFTFFRPYHLWFLEAPISIARAYFERQTTLVPLDRPVADVATYAKRDLAVDDSLDEFGGFTSYGKMDTAESVRAAGALPVGLAPGARVTRVVKKGTVITWDDVALDEGSTVVRLRRAMDAREGGA